MTAGIDQDLSLSVLRFLLEDVRRRDPRLSNPVALSFALLAVPFPAPPVRELAARYLSPDNDAPHLQAHAEPQKLLAGWPLSEEESEDSKRRIREFQAAIEATRASPDSESKARGRLTELLKSPRFADRVTAIEVCTEWLRNSARFQGLVGSPWTFFSTPDRALRLRSSS